MFTRSNPSIAPLDSSNRVVSAPVAAPRGILSYPSFLDYSRGVHHDLQNAPTQPFWPVQHPMGQYSTPLVDSALPNAAMNWLSQQWQNSMVPPLQPTLSPPLLFSTSHLSALAFCAVHATGFPNQSRMPISVQERDYIHRLLAQRALADVSTAQENSSSAETVPAVASLSPLRTKIAYDHPPAAVAAKTFATMPPASSCIVPVRQDATVMVHGVAMATVSASPFPTLTCHSIPLAQSTDVGRLSSLQVLLRLQIEAFTATPEHVETHKQGRTKPVRVGQVGIRCRHCAHLPLVLHATGSTYFPTSVQGFYQASQNMRMMHLQSGKCSAMPDCVKAQFAAVSASATKGPMVSGAGRAYWTKSARSQNLVDTDQGIFLDGCVPNDASVVHDSTVYQGDAQSKKRVAKHEKAKHAAMWTSSKKLKK